jgi:uncharacterized membrane protein
MNINNLDKKFEYKDINVLTIDNQNEILNKRLFAEGIGLDKLIWLFFICSVGGDFIETIYCKLVLNEWMSRSSVIYGPFSIVWGLGGVLLTLLIKLIRNKSLIYIFGIGFVLGGVYEYLCSLFTEVFFGTVFWDYSFMYFNLEGRINLLFCVFWGIIAIIWVRVLYPLISNIIERIPYSLGKVITYIGVIFMIINIILSVIVMERYIDRQNNEEAENAIERYIDREYDDEYIEWLWPDMIIVKK